MKKNIQDYIGQKAAIFCNTQQEWDIIRVLDEAKYVKSDRFGESNCININSSKIFGHCYKQWYENNGYAIYNASDFLDNNSSNYWW